jgi:hypothetical protein
MIMETWIVVAYDPDADPDGRYPAFVARTFGPFTSAGAANRFGAAYVAATMRREWDALKVEAPPATDNLHELVAAARDLSAACADVERLDDLEGERVRLLDALTPYDDMEA